MEFDIMKSTTNRTIQAIGLTANITKDYSEKAFTGNSRFPICRYFGSAGKTTVEAFSFGVIMSRSKNAYAERLYNEFYINREMSLQDIANLESKSRQSIYSLFKTRNYKLRPKTVLPFVEFNGLKFTVNNEGYYRRTDGDRGLMHRYVWHFYRGRIPNNYDIHHKNHNKQDNRIENLELITKSEHTIKHNKQPVRTKYCKQCDCRIERHKSESPSAYNRRFFCGFPCSRRWMKGKPKGTRVINATL